MNQEDKISVLIVDDIPAILLALETILDDLGLNIVKAGSGPADGLYLFFIRGVPWLDPFMPGGFAVSPVFAVVAP